MPGVCPSASCATRAHGGSTVPGQRLPHHSSRRLPPRERVSGAPSHGAAPGMGAPPSALHRASPASGAMRARGKLSTVARRKTRSVLRPRWPPSGAAAWCPTPRARRRRGARPVLGGAAVHTCGAHARPAWRLCRRPTASLPGPQSARQAPTQPRGKASPSGVRPLRSPRPWPSPAPCAPLMTRGAAPAHAFGSTRPNTTRPRPCPAHQLGRAWAPSSVASCSTPCTRAIASHGCRLARRIAAASRGPKHLGATAAGRRATRGGTPPYART
jgi:hypothetical protein